MAGVTLLKIDRWWTTHFGTMMASVYLVLAISPTPPPLHVLLGTLALFTVATLGIGTFGHLLNDLTDIEQDARRGARNLLATSSTVSRTLLLVATLIVGILPWWWLPTTPAVAALVAAEYALFALYSVPPVRFKERGVPGLVADALYAYMVPNAFAILLFANLANATIPTWILVAVLAWCFCFGLERIVYHELLDAAGDIRSNARTFVVRHGWQRSFEIDLYCLVPATTAAFLLMIGVWATISPIVPVAYFSYAALTVWSYCDLRGVPPVDRLSRVDCYHLISDRLNATFVWRWLSLFALATLVVKCPRYLPLVPLHLALFSQPVVWAWWQGIPQAARLFRSICRRRGRSGGPGATV
jgi:hypothetical protein